MSRVRVYAAADSTRLRELLAGRPVQLDVVIADSDDEQDEHDALLTAAESGPVVVTAEVAAAGDPIAPSDVQAYHLDADGSGDLAWYAPQELDQVIAIAESG